MTMTLEDAVTALRVHARQHEAILTIVHAIKSASSLEQLKSEGEKRLSVIQLKIDQVESEGKQRLSLVQAKIDEEEKKLSEVLGKLEKAKAAAQEVAKVSEEQLEKRLGKRREEVAALDERLAGLGAEIVARNKSLDDINAAIAEARTRMATFLGNSTASP